ncbi:MAG: NUDIX hydrolase [Tepidibacillus sp.]|uniref:NUDIX hydrolase n=1 Tax=Tepidibacillus sp. HK-1 TaxID=1883407 RepID=UPI000853DDD9|nr:NUDIX hydrolase [Tepidibacillus sp. HK-1]GBF12539.1 ADP-ribose pyrophosphatase [Tepidibacillus sp. HK-1]
MYFDYSEKTISSEKIYQGKIIQVKVDTVLLPNGKEAKRELVNHPGAIAVLALTPEDKIILVRQYRKPLEKTILEIPAGKLEKGENPLDCAIRELKEETGYIASNMTQITKFYTSPGFADEIIYLYKANSLEQGEAKPDEDEFIETVELSLDEALERIKTGEVIDAKTIMAIYYWQLERNKG